ncbi:RAN GTPase-activating protein 1 [Capsicum annuum]|uniref:RAN GTPase-activating protein 1 n=2 Tax=Capsicum annuum TaxID=4072 RepID=A0A1U8DZ62_CAPAN|nr:RAN GTPase-activating protein 2 isoform X2 [Capsicum annuum]KAF3649888.1 RAN GTPase-activating protein 1 [Capsicum annuum]KAF3662600.1 RAN GTPase-activating protein 1 [Capsicum annuum]PHT94943.1 RAN GTPase-activating protein 1 [Capsicum annuum]
MDATILNSQRRPFSIKLWPPSENTRKMLVERMTNNLSSPTIFTRKYRCLSKEDAATSAEQIEHAAFTVSSQHYEKEPDGDGSSAVQLYAKECSKLILELLKQMPRSEHEEISFSEVIPTVQETFFDISKGKRAFIEAEEAQELLKPLKESGNSFSKICFSNRSFGVNAARIAGPILASLKDQLKEVDLSDFVAGRNEAEALDVMNIFSEALEDSNLKFLNLSDNALGEKGVRAFGKLLQSQTNLEELFLMNDGISQEAARAVSELVPSTEKLKVLHFHNNMTGDEGAVAIAEIVKRSPLLEDFRCSSTRVGSEGGIALCEALGMCSHLKKLDLRDNMFGPEAGLVLSKALSKHENLTEVYLSYLNLEDEGAIAIANALKDAAPSLGVLEMAGNDITAEAAPAIASCIAAKQLLSKLSFAENELKDEGAIQIAKGLQGHNHLIEVDMTCTGIRRAGARVLAQTVLLKDEFKSLNVNGNFISEEGVDELKEIFKKSPEMLASLEDNDPEGEDEDEDEEESGDEGKDEDELESKLKILDVKKEESLDAPDSN